MWYVEGLQVRVVTQQVHTVVAAISCFATSTARIWPRADPCLLALSLTSPEDKKRYSKADRTEFGRVGGRRLRVIEG